MSTTHSSNRPTTPLRSASRTSFRVSHTPNTNGQTPTTSTTPSSQQVHPSLHSPLLHLEPGFAELSDSLADLEANMQLLHLQHESVARFTENFAAFLYGIDMNAYCVDWTQAPTKESWERVRKRQQDARDMGEDETVVLAGTPRGKGSAMADASILSTTSTRTASTTGNNTSRLRTPARRSGIARGLGARGARIANAARGGSSRPASSTSGTGPGTRSRDTRAGRPGTTTSRGRGDSSGASGTTGGIVARARGWGRGVGRGRDAKDD